MPTNVLARRRARCRMLRFAVEIVLRMVFASPPTYAWCRNGETLLIRSLGCGIGLSGFGRLVRQCVYFQVIGGVSGSFVSLFRMLVAYAIVDFAFSIPAAESVVFRDGFDAVRPFSTIRYTKP